MFFETSGGTVGNRNKNKGPIPFENKQISGRQADPGKAEQKSKMNLKIAQNAVEYQTIGNIVKT